MANLKTAIEWTDATWSPVTGCSKVSAGCKNCYAERHWLRLAGGVYKGRKFTDVRCHPERLGAPLHWRKPSRIFVNSMSDLFHEDVPDDFIDKVFARMMLADRHTFQVLTKRPEWMREYFSDLAYRTEQIGIEIELVSGHDRYTVEREPRWPLPFNNVWLGVSVEDQATADERIPILLQTPAAVRFVSLEPLLEAVNLRRIAHPDRTLLRGVQADTKVSVLDGAMKVDWVIVGGESGPNARPCNVEHIRSIVRQCKAAGVPVFVKQVGALPYDDPTGFAGGGATEDGTTVAVHHRLPLRDRKGGDPAEWPEDLRGVREYPR